MGNHGYADFIRRRHLKQSKAKQLNECEPLREWLGNRRESINHSYAKSRFDRYVCAVASGNSTRHPDLMMDVAEISEWAIQLMLAADKRWEEYTKGETP